MICHSYPILAEEFPYVVAFSDAVERFLVPVKLPCPGKRQPTRLPGCDLLGSPIVSMWWIAVISAAFGVTC